MADKIAEKQIDFLNEMYKLGFSHKDIGIYMGLAEKTVRKYAMVKKGEKNEAKIDAFFSDPKNMGMIQELADAKRARAEKDRNSAKEFLKKDGPNLLKVDAIKALYKFQVPDPEKYYRQWRNSYVTG